MKKTVRLLALVSICLMIFALSACKPDTENSESGKGESSTSTTQKVVDLEKYNFVIGTKWMDGWGNTEDGKSDAGDKWIRWRRDFEENFNCTVEIQPIELYTLFETLGPRIMSGEKVADVLECQIMDVEKFRHAGLLVPWQNVAGVNMADWESQISQLNTYNGKSYMLSTGVPIPNTGVLVNLSMLKRLQLEDPYQLVYDKKWTLDKMRAMAKKATVDNGDGVWDKEDQYGVGLWSNFITGMLKSNGVNFIEQKDGKMQYGLNSNKTIDILKGVREFVQTDKSNYPVNPDTHAEYVEKFIAGKLLFITVPGNFPDQYKEMQDMEDDYGFLPSPTMNEGEDYSFFMEHWTAGLAVPNTSDQLDKVGVLINSIKGVTGEVNDMHWDIWSRNYRDHEPTINVLKMLSTNGLTDLYNDQPFLSVAVQATHKSVYDASSEPGSTMEELADKMQKAIEDYYKNDPDFGEAK